MILANGIVHPSAEQACILAELPEHLHQTLAAAPLSCETVIAALDRMSCRMTAGEFDTLLTTSYLRSMLWKAAEQLSREALTFRVQTELGADWEKPVFVPASGLTKRTMRLGVILHIAAGNMDALPAWSVIEGLLAGNINLLKLPQADSGLTIRFFQALLEDAPELRDFIYVFDTPSTDIAGMQALASHADGIAVWGGEAAVSAVRQLAPTGCKLIEWGHRLGFCYISGTPQDSDLTALAAHILETKQLLCSSCQVIYLDTADFAAVRAFCERFLPFLERAAAVHPVTELGAAAQLTLQRRTEELESILTGKPAENRIFQGKACSLTACRDSRLELSGMYGNVLVKPLPFRDMTRILRKTAGHLQTAGLICADADRTTLTEALLRSGLNRVLQPGEMSAAFPGESHDGEYPLRRYTRVTLYKAGDSQ